MEERFEKIRVEAHNCGLCGEEVDIEVILEYESHYDGLCTRCRHDERSWRADKLIDMLM